MSLINWVLKLFDSLPDALKVVILLVLIVGLIVTTALSIVYRRAERATKKQLREVTENREEYRKRLEGLDQAKGHI